MTEKRNNAVGPQIRARQQTRGKITPVLAVLFLIAGLMTATQFFAHDFRYQTALGSHYRLFYPPWAILVWASHWYAKYPEAFIKSGSVGLTVSSVGLMILAVIKMSSVPLLLVNTGGSSNSFGPEANASEVARARQTMARADFMCSPNFSDSRIAGYTAMYIPTWSRCRSRRFKRACGNCY